MSLRKWGLRCEGEFTYEEPEFDITPMLNESGDWVVKYTPNVSLELLDPEDWFFWSAYEV